MNTLKLPPASEAIELLASIFPSHSATSLSSILSSCGGDLQRATDAILSDVGSAGPTGSSNSKKRGGLDAWLSKPSIGSSKAITKKQRRIPEIGGDMYGPRVVKGTASTSGSTFSILDSLKPAPPLVLPPLPPLILNTAEMIELHTGGLCQLVTNVLPKDLASRLFLRMVKESLGDDGGVGCEWSGTSLSPIRQYLFEYFLGDKNRWTLNERAVESPHTSSFYYESRPTALSSAETGYDIDGFKEAAKYW